MKVAAAITRNNASTPPPATVNSWNISETWLVFSGEEVAAFTKSCQEYRVLFKKNPFFAFETGPEARCVFFYRFMLLFYRFMLFLC